MLGAPGHSHIPRPAPTSPGCAGRPGLLTHACAKSSLLFSSVCLQGMLRVLHAQGPCQELPTARDHSLRSSVRNKALCLEAETGEGRAGRKPGAGDLFPNLTKRPRHLHARGTGVFRKGEEMVLGSSKPPTVQDGWPFLSVTPKPKGVVYSSLLQWLILCISLTGPISGCICEDVSGRD